MIEAEEMQKAVHGEMREVVIERFILAARLALDGLVSEHDVAQMIMSLNLIVMPIARPIAGISGRKGQPIGRRIDAAPIAIEPAYCSIVGQNNGEFGRVPRHGGGRLPHRAAHDGACGAGLPPMFRIDQHVDL